MKRTILSVIFIATLAAAYGQTANTADSIQIQKVLKKQRAKKTAGIITVCSGASMMGISTVMWVGIVADGTANVVAGFFGPVPERNYRRSARIANTLFLVGSAAVVTGTILWVSSGTKKSKPARLSVGIESTTQLKLGMMTAVPFPAVRLQVTL